MRKPFLLSTVAALAAVALAGCSLGASSSAGAEAGSLAEHGTLDGVSLTVGSKEFTEQLVLCEITAVTLESVGADVQRNCGMTGTSTVRAALLSGDIDMFWEYTGTGWVTHLQETTPIVDPQAQYEAVAKADLERNGVRWFQPAPANNTYAIATTNEKAAELGLSTISDYATIAKRDPAAASFCGASEFFGRGDGWPGLSQAYGFELPRSATAELALGAVYNSIDTANPCAFGEVFATDGRIPALGLKVLEDDKNFFTPYNPALTVREEVAKANPQLAEILAPVSAALDDEALRALNARVDVDGETPEQVAPEWLREKGFIA